MSNKILDQVNHYYSDKIVKNGATPQGVDWNSAESQELRFKILSDVINSDEKFSVLDYGCGFGSMFEYYLTQYKDFQYVGFDISEQMIVEAKKRNDNYKNASWITELQPDTKVDYVITSGIFNVKFNNSNEEWFKYIIETLHKMDAISEKGFSFNLLTSYSDKEYMRDNLYYADPCFFFNYCKTNFSKYICLKHDYPIYEFSIIVRK